MGELDVTPGTAMADSLPGLPDPSKAVTETVKLLLVDDDGDNLLALQAVLEPLNQTLMLARSGTDALRLCLEHDFAAILLDVRMPDMDGFETAQLIRNRRRSRLTPILFLTAYRSDEQLFRGYDLGAVDFLFKPIVPEILQSKVTVFVELSRSHQLLQRQTEALARTEQKFRALLEAAPDAMVITETNGNVILANSRTDGLFGYRREQLIGMDVRAMIPGLSLIREASEQQRNSRLLGRRADGSSFQAEVTQSVLESDEGRLLTSAIRDVTEQVAAETRVRLLNTELEKLVAERTQELTRSNAALRLFAWAASHDLQEPVRIVLSYSQWLAKSAGSKLSGSELEMLTFLVENATRMRHLIEGLREYLLINESAEQSLAAVDCNAALKTALANLSSLLAKSGASIAAETLPTIQSVEVLLIQLLQNLISNAIKYRSQRPPCVHIAAQRRENSVVFSVSDNGIGIESEYLEYVFGVFKRLHSREYEGAGIGLAICKSVVERLGGRIWVESEFGVGSTFFFELPEKGPG